ncbi:ORF6N domain-containing protein [Litoribacter ruber]|uniref:ORF6N domain-containing protein n=1 Tax=Litoribacter ruber TaxID=702568 RepID=UPI0037437B17
MRMKKMILDKSAIEAKIATSSRFPPDFMFQLTIKEWIALRSQNATSSENGLSKFFFIPSLFNIFMALNNNRHEPIDHK